MTGYLKRPALTLLKKEGCLNRPAITVLQKKPRDYLSTEITVIKTVNIAIQNKIQ